MNPQTDPQRKFLDHLRQLLRAAENGRLDLSGELVLFVVGLDSLSPKEAKAWLREVIRDRGRVLLGGEQISGTVAPVPSRTGKGPAGGVGPEEKSLLWGK